MPLYEYECTACGRRTETLQRVDEAPLEECPHCGGRLRKLLSAPAFQFKGAGWYVTDYAGKSERAGAGTGDAKPAAEGEAKTPASAGGGDKPAGGETPAAKSRVPE